ncbi:MAG: transporter substrate-binding domain-containing protein [Hormoscilla sp. SP12CHS1]|nr:transporter substrate-binding domain-containing protein [Hormoscilla sp. SP12CHS1]
MAAELEAIAQRGYLIVGVKDNLRPLGFRDARGNLQGLEIDIARRLAAELLGSPDAVKLQPLANQDRLDVVQSRAVDLAIARVTTTEPRLRIVSLSRPYYIDGTAFVTKLEIVGQLEDLAGQRIALLNGASTIASVRYFLPKARLVGVDSYQEALALLESGAADVFAADASVLAGWVQEYRQYRLLPYLISAEALSVVMPKGLQYDDLRRQVNQAISRCQESGWLDERAKHWGLPVPELNRKSY